MENRTNSPYGEMPNRPPVAQSFPDGTGSALETCLLQLIADFRRMNTKTVIDTREVESVHRRADAVLEKFPEMDDREDRWDDPARVEHRNFVARISRSQHLY